jgi:hypothetical protein
MHVEIAGVDTSEVIEAESGVSILELLPDSSDVESHASDGSWTHGSRLDRRGFDIRRSSGSASIVWFRNKVTAWRGPKEPSNPQTKLPQPSFAKSTRASPP